MSAARSTFDSLLADLRDAARSLRRSPGITGAAVLVLALGIGANAAVWSALRATLLATVDAPAPERLVVPRMTFQDEGGASPHMMPWSRPKFEVLRGFEGRLVEPVAGYSTRAVTVSGGEQAARVDLQVADPELFELLGVTPALGALYSRDPSSGRVEEGLVTLLSHRLWIQRFGGDPGVIGDSVMVNGAPLTILGVLPSGFRGLGGEEGLWAPFEATPSLFHPRQLEWEHAHWFQAIGRLAPGVELAAARRQIEAIGSAVDRAHPDPGTGEQGAALFTLDEVRRNPTAETAVLLLAGAAALVLLIACGNLATLFLGRGADRWRDASIRQALGAGRWRIVRAALVEAWLLSALGGVAGLGLAFVGARALAAVWPERFVMGENSIRYAQLEPMGVDASSLLLALLLSTLASLAFGALPALRLAARGSGSALREAGIGGEPGDRTPRLKGVGLRGALVAAQVALTLVLLVSTALLLQSLLRLSRVGTGVAAPEEVMVARYEIPRTSPAAEDPAELHRRVTEALGAAPGVISAAVGTASPFAGHDWITGVRRIDGRPEYGDAERPAIGIAAVDDRFFRTLGIGLVAGRTFDRRDRADSAPVIVLSRAAARELYGEEAPLGRRIALGIGLTPSDSDTMAEVVGVVEDVLYDRPEAGVIPDAYVSHRQEPLRHAVVLVRASSDPLALAPIVRETLATLDPALPLYGVTTLDALRRDGMDDTRVLGSLLSLGALVALALAAVGTYGAMSCWVDGRGRELGLRMALGARAGQVLALVLSRGLAMLAAGAVVGTAAALLAGRLLEGVLFQVDPREPTALAVALIAMVGVGLLACWLPARRAGRTDPSSVLRGE